MMKVAGGAGRCWLRKGEEEVHELDAWRHFFCFYEVGSQ